MYIHIICNVWLYIYIYNIHDVDIYNVVRDDTLSITTYIHIIDSIWCICSHHLQVCIILYMYSVHSVHIIELNVHVYL